jgi:hypothetical protein
MKPPFFTHLHQGIEKRVEIACRKVSGHQARRNSARSACRYS